LDGCGDAELLSNNDSGPPALSNSFAVHGGRIPFNLNYETPDPARPVNVVRGAPAETNFPTALVLNQTSKGQSVAMEFDRPN
jgi:hypothetical protein